MHVAPAIGPMLIANVKPAHIAELYAKLRSEPITYQQRVKDSRCGGWTKQTRQRKPLGPNSTVRVHRLLHRIFGWAERMNLVARNVVRLVDAPKAAASPARSLSVDQVVQILNAAEGTQLHAFLTLAAMTGMRRGEIGGLTWDAIDLKAGTATVRQAIGEDRRGNSFVKTTKSGRERIVPLNAAVIAALRSQRAVQNQDRLLSHGAYQEQGFVFADVIGQRIDLDIPTKVFAKLARRLGIKARGVSLHSLRHCAATMALQAGADVRTVAALLGHASPSTTLNIYGHVVAGAQERAVNAIVTPSAGRRRAPRGVRTDGPELDH